MGIPEDYDDDTETSARTKAIAEHAKEAERKDVPPKMETLKRKSTVTANSLQECVGEHLKNKKLHPRGNGPRGNSLPVIVVRGRKWSPSVFRNARLAGWTTERAWCEAFVQ